MVFHENKINYLRECDANLKDIKKFELKIS